MSHYQEMGRLHHTSQEHHFRVKQWKLTPQRAMELCDEVGYLIGQNPLQLYASMTRGECEIFGARVALIPHPAWRLFVKTGVTPD